MQQKQLEEQRERNEKERLEALGRKDKHEQSAVASSGVKEKLQVHPSPLNTRFLNDTLSLWMSMFSC